MIRGPNSTVKGLKTQIYTFWIFKSIFEIFGWVLEPINKLNA